jgi:acetyltransferase-like isoleucine patch superfamily enzyme
MIGALLTRMRQRRSPLFLALKRVVHGVRTFRLPLPDFLRPLLRLGFYAQQATLNAIRWLLAVCIYEPLFRGRCSSAGKRLRITRMPYVVGPTSIRIGDDVNFFGKVDIASGYVCQNPKLILHDRVDLGHKILFVVNQLIEIESDVNVASGVSFMDTDAHPRDMAARIADLPPGEGEVQPVRICRGAWIGQNAAILKGVTVGEGAIIGINSVVVTDVPPHTVAMGNPARVVVKNTPRAPT